MLNLFSPNSSLISIYELCIHHAYDIVFMVWLILYEMKDIALIREEMRFNQI